MTRNKESNDVTITIDKSKKNRGGCRRLVALTKGERCYLAVAFFFLACSAFVSMALPIGLKSVLNLIYQDNTEKSKERLNLVCFLLVLVFTYGAICNYARTFIFTAAAYRMIQKLRKRTFAAILIQDIDFFESTSTGELVNRLASDTEVIGQALSVAIAEFLRSILVVVISITLMFIEAPLLTVYGISAIIPFVLVSIVFGKFIQRISKQIQQVLADATQVAEERIANIRTVKIFACEEREINLYTKRIDAVLKMGYKESHLKGFFYAAVGLCANGIIIMVLYFGGKMINNKELTVGGLTSFIIYAVYISLNLAQFSLTFAELNKAIGAEQSINGYITRKPRISLKRGYIPKKPLNGAINFENVYFAYPQREEAAIFEDLNFYIEPKQTVALVGPSGSGKSTIGLLLLRLYDIDAGNIFLDGYNLSELNPTYLRRCIGTVSQEPVLFSFTIRDNITYGIDDPRSITDQQLEKISAEANALDFIQNLPHGFDTLVGERGVMLSGGQKQRIAIARALLKDPRVLILDEATSALDSESEMLVQEALDRMMKGRTVLIIAHRLSTIKNADIIYVLKDGKIMETGNYEELIHIKKGLFRKLVKLQLNKKSHHHHHHHHHHNQPTQDTESNYNQE